MENSFNLLPYGKIFSLLIGLFHLIGCVTSPSKGYENIESLKRDSNTSTEQGVGFSITQTGYKLPGPILIEIIAGKIGESKTARFNGQIRDAYKNKATFFVPIELGVWSIQSVTVQIPSGVVNAQTYPGQTIEIDKSSALASLSILKDSFLYLGEIKIASYGLKTEKPDNRFHNLQTNVTYIPFAPYSESTWSKWDEYLNKKNKYTLALENKRTIQKPLQRIFNQKTIRNIEYVQVHQQNNLVLAISNMKGVLFFENLETGVAYRIEPLQLKSNNHLYIANLGASEKVKLLGFCPVTGKTSTGSSDLKEQCWLETAIPLKGSGAIQNTVPLTAHSIRVLGFLEYKLSQEPKLIFSINDADIENIKTLIPQKDLRTLVLNTRIRTKPIGQFDWVDEKGAPKKGWDRLSAKFLLDFRPVVKECAMALWNTDPLSTTHFTAWMFVKEKILVVDPAQSKTLDGEGLQMFSNCINRFTAKNKLLGNEMITKGFGIEFRP